ncbi:MAG TPA: CPBP family intramembrane glutamic endopeptidase [Kofleriaceae bacterium]
MYHASRAPVVEPITAIGVLGAALASYLLAAALAPRDWALVAAQLALAAVPAGMMSILRPERPLAALGLRGARPRFFVAAIAIGATAWYLNLWLAAALPLPEQQVHELEALVDRPPLGRALAMFALLPAVCEEILFRGVLARSLGRSTSLIVATLVSAVVFSAYHLSLVQALPTLSLGALLAVLAIRADSIAPTMVAHAINNALAIVLSRGELPGVADWLGQHPPVALAGCATATLLGIGIAVRGST